MADGLIEEVTTVYDPDDGSYYSTLTVSATLEGGLTDPNVLHRERETPSSADRADPEVRTHHANPGEPAGRTLRQHPRTGMRSRMSPDDQDDALVSTRASSPTRVTLVVVPTQPYR